MIMWLPLLMNGRLLRWLPLVLLLIWVQRLELLAQLRPCSHGVVCVLWVAPPLLLLLAHGDVMRHRCCWAWLLACLATGCCLWRCRWLIWNAGCKEPEQL